MGTALETACCGASPVYGLPRPTWTRWFTPSQWRVSFSLTHTPVSYSDSAYISNINWISKADIDDKDIACKFRYRQADQKVHIKKLSESEALLTYPEGIKAVTPGQQAVFYLDGEILGGGTIESTYTKDLDLASTLDARVLGHIKDGKRRKT